MSDGLDLEPFLRLIRADLGIWISLAVVALILGVMAWTSWGSRRVLRKCLVLSILAHLGLVVYSGGIGAAGPAEGPGADRIQSIRVVSVDRGGGPERPTPGHPGRWVAEWDRLRDTLPASDLDPIEARRVTRPDEPPAPPDRAEPVAPPSVSPPEPSSPEIASPEDGAGPSPAPPIEVAVAPIRPEDLPPEAAPPPAEGVPSPSPDGRIRVARAASASETPAGRSRPELAPAEPAEPKLADLPSMNGGREDRGSPDGPPVPPAPEPPIAREPSRPAEVAGDVPPPGEDLRDQVRGVRGAAIGLPDRRSTAGLAPIAIARTTPSGGSRMPSLPAPSSGLPPVEVPESLGIRVAPDRFVKAERSGASAASEEAVEKALEWLARHQDADGRWNAGTKKYSDGSVVPGEANFTQHCPPGDACSGECYYWEADTALTGLALLAYLGNGQTHRTPGGKYASTVARGLEFLKLSQKGDGDLRGPSRTVGMYCHAMATLALCEAYALTADQSLRGPAEKGVAFLVRSRAADGLSWRYGPGEASGDTSVLGWAVLVIKSAREVGIPVPDGVRAGARTWLNLVAEGPEKGLAVYRPGEGPYGGASNYQPGRNRTPTMTAEAWACRQFLGVGGPGPASDEAARFLLANAPDRGRVNFYYWYYGSLAMFQNGGESWDRWNARVRDGLIALQKTSGHQAGSWDARDSKSVYDDRGGRIYATALAAMTLEVYYRYGRPADAMAPDPVLRRAGRR